MCSEEKLKRENWWIVNVWSLSFLIWAKTSKLKMSHRRTSVRTPVQSVITHLISRMCIRQIVPDRHCCWCPQWVRLNFNRITWTLGWHNNNTYSDKLWTITMHSSICPQGQITLQAGPGAKNSHGPCWPAPSLCELSMNVVPLITHQAQSTQQPTNASLSLIIQYLAWRCTYQLAITDAL